MRSPADLGQVLEAELRENLLPFWRQRAPDQEHGGFIGAMDHDGTVLVDAPKGLILNSRILWTFAAVFRRFGDPLDLDLAQRALDYLLERFADRDHGGFHWLLTPLGRPLESLKKIYGQAFCIYALSEFWLATGDDEALEEAKDLFRLIERHAHDDEHGGYIEALAADWSPALDLRLSHKDMNSPKSMNNHLHVLEAYTNLYRAWPDLAVAQRLRECIDLFRHRVIESTATGCHLRHFFDSEWNPCSDSYSYGHDIEAAWLLCDAAEVVGDQDLLRAVGTRAVELARSVLSEGLDQEGGLAYEGRDGEVIDANREWWCQAEAVVGFWRARELTGEVIFAEAAEKAWSFVDSHVVDRENGEWFWRVHSDGSVDASEPKVSEWKGPYHNTRMCLEMMQRLTASEQARV